MNKVYLGLGDYYCTESRLKELQDIFSLIDDNADLSKELFFKLKRDMACELGLK